MLVLPEALDPDAGPLRRLRLRELGLLSRLDQQLRVDPDALVRVLQGGAPWGRWGVHPELQRVNAVDGGQHGHVLLGGLVPAGLPVPYGLGRYLEPSRHRLLREPRVIPGGPQPRPEDGQRTLLRR